MQKTIWTIVIVILLALGGWWVAKQSSTVMNKTIKIGALIPLTGKLASYGDDIRNTLTLANEEIQQSGKNGFDIVFEDSAGDPKTALSGARKLIDIDRVLFVIGGPGSSGNLAVAPVFEKNAVFFFPTSNTNKLNSAGAYIFKLNPDVDFEAERVAKHLLEYKFAKIAVLYDSANDTTIGGATVFKEQFKDKKETLILFEGFDSRSGTDVRTSLTNIKKIAPDALFFVLGDKLAGVALRQAREIGISAPVFGWSGLNGSEFFNAAGSYADGTVITDLPFSCVGNNVMQQFCKKYSEHFSGRIPTSYGAVAYDVLSILSDILADSRSSEFGDEEKQLVQESFSDKSYEGISGTLKFDSEGNIRDKDFVFRVAKDGKFVDLK